MRWRATHADPGPGQYFTLSGSAIDYGEDGLVGRGNARTGLISGAHRAGNEATFGKNPAYHIGKVGGWFADTATAAVAAQRGSCRGGPLWCNGARYTDPAHIGVTRGVGDDVAETLVRATLTRTDWMKDLLAGRYLPRVLPREDLLAELERAP